VAASSCSGSSPGIDTVRIDSTGEYVIYTADGSFFASVEVISPDGEPVRTSRYLTSIAIGDSIAGDLLRAILIPFVIVGITFLLGLIIIVVTAVKRSGSKKRAAFAG
jgi:hypothetical protein